MGTRIKHYLNIFYFKLNVNLISDLNIQKIFGTFDLPEQAVTPTCGIQVVQTTEPIPVTTVCRIEPS